jgi:hypothetical protein
VVTGTLTEGFFDWTTMAWTPPDVSELFFDLTAPSDGTLAAYSSGDPVYLFIDGVLFDNTGPGPFVGTIPVVAGRTYRVWVWVSFDYWDYGGSPDYRSFVITTTLFPPGAAVPIGCRLHSPVPGWVCISGDWIPPDHPEALAGSPAPPAPPAPAPAANSCVTTQPVSNWVCINGDWVPPDHPIAIANPPAQPAPSPAPSAPPPAPAPPSPPPPVAPNCTTQDPFAGIPGLYGVCVGTEWVPIGHPEAPSVPIAVTGVQPAAGTTGKWVKIFGVGFGPDTKVTFGGIAATTIRLAGGGLLFAVAPAHNAGAADVAVQNPGGPEATLVGAYTYLPVTVTATPTVVSPGATVTVSWTAPGGQFSGDWIGLYKVGDPNDVYISYEYTGGTSSGSHIFVLPLQPGSYEFRYLPDDGYYDAARSSPITVVMVVGGSPQ